MVSSTSANAPGGGKIMTRSGTPVSVINDIGVIRDVLVQGPVRNPFDEVEEGDEKAVGLASRQHQRMVQELEAAGVSVRHMDVLLHSALGFADARDWILERRMTGDDHELGNAGCDIISWLSEQPAETLTRCLMEGMKTGELPAVFEPVVRRFDETSDWLLPPLDGVMKWHPSCRRWKPDSTVRCCGHRGSTHHHARWLQAVGADLDAKGCRASSGAGDSRASALPQTRRHDCT
jgi:hypothetical protein